MKGFYNYLPVLAVCSCVCKSVVFGLKDIPPEPEILLYSLVLA